MGKKKQRPTYTSKGTGSSVAKHNLVPATAFEKMQNKLKAFHEGRRVMLTIENPNPKETNRRHIRVEASTVWGDWKAHKSGMIEKKDQPRKKGKTKK